MPMNIASDLIRRCCFCLILALLSLPVPEGRAQDEVQAHPTQPPPFPEQEPPQQFKWIEADYELDAYYSNVSLTIALTKDPIPSLGEQEEDEIYRYMTYRALLPRFLYFEISVNPLPYIGVSVRKHHPDFYNDAELSESFNWVKTLTAGFEEPWAASVFAGTVIDFEIPGRKDTKGKGFSGYLISAGNYHIKDNTLIKDDWWEYEWKVKGDRKSLIKKLNWSFRIGAKLHGNPDITDILYVSFRRSRVDFRPERDSFFNNTGFEYTYDMNRRGLHGIRHYLFVDKKWPYAEKQMALALAVGFVWESADKYTGPLRIGRPDDEFQFILRPNIEF